MRNALFLCLSLVKDLDSALAAELLGRDVIDWYQHLEKQKSHQEDIHSWISLIQDGGKHIFAKNLPLKGFVESLRLQTVRLLCELFEFSGGVTACEFEDPDLSVVDITPSQCHSLYGYALEGFIMPSKNFGTFDLEEIVRALSESRRFSKSSTVDTVEWRRRMLEDLTVGILDDHLVYLLNFMTIYALTEN
jgi:hypothetical protein